jgi:hypothetical protein
MTTAEVTPGVATAVPLQSPPGEKGECVGAALITLPIEKASAPLRVPLPGEGVDAWSCDGESRGLAASGAAASEPAPFASIVVLAS